jgi:hypothetical protein
MIAPRSLLVLAVMLVLSAPASAQSAGVKFWFKSDPKNGVACIPYDPMFATELFYVEENGQERVYGRRGYLVATFSATRAKPRSEYQIVVGSEHFQATLDVTSTPKLLVVAHRNVACRWLADIP